MTRTVWRMAPSVRSAGALLVLVLTAAACGPDPLAEVGQNTTTTSSSTTTSTTTTTEPPVTLPVDPIEPHVAPFDPPGEEWATAPAPEGVDGDALAALVDSAVATNRWGPVTAVVVAKDGQLIAEGYRDGHDADSLFASGTMSTIVINALVGALIADQALQLFEPWWVSEWANDERFAITPNMMLRHITGAETGDAVSLELLRRAAADGSVADWVITQPWDGDEQYSWTRFEFSPGNHAVLAQVIEENVLVNGALSLWANERVFAPIGVTSARFDEDASGTWIGFEGVNMTAPDYVRLGTLYASNGLWGDEVVLARDWLEYTSTVLAPSTEFGAGFWVDRFGDGTLSVESNGQRLVIVPEEGLVILVLSVFASDAVIEEFTQDLTAAVRTG